jgi:hypothetical protein
MLACGDARQAAAPVDSALSRDLTLASSAAPGAGLGDTAVTTPTAPPPRVETPPPVPRPTPSPARTPDPAPVRRPRTDPPVIPPVAPSTTPAPVPTPVEAAPAPAAAPGPARGKAIGTGSALSGATTAQICSIANRPGDRFVVSLAREVTGPDGALIPAGTPVLVEMAQPTASGEFVFRLKGVQLHGDLIPAEGTVQVDNSGVTERKVSQGGEKGKVVTGAIAGAILGRVLGGGAKGTVIGAAGGAAAGTIAAARNAVTERCLPAGATLTATLTSPLVLPNSTP